MARLLICAPARQMPAAQLGARAFDRMTADTAHPSAMRFVDHFGSRRIDVGDVGAGETATQRIFEQP